MLKRFLRDKSGATAIEYALIATLISVAIATGMAGVSEEVRAMFSEASSKFNK